MTNPMMGKGPDRYSRKVGSATDSMETHDVDDFDRGGAEGGMHAHAPAVDPIKVISEFSRLGDSLKTTSNFREIAEQIARISEMAESTIMQETGDWFDQHTVKRNMKELKGHAKNFAKLGEELDAMHQRATALYDDMGNVLTRYFELNGDQGTPEEAPFGGEKAPEFDGPGGHPTDDAGRQKWDMRDGEADDSDDLEEAGGWGSPKNVAGHTSRAQCPHCSYSGKKRDVNSHVLDKHGSDKAEKFLEKESAVAPDKYNARRALKLPRSQQRVQGGFTRDMAKDILKKGGAKTVSEARKSIVQEMKRMIDEGEVVLPKGKGKVLKENAAKKEAILRNIVKQHQHAEIEGQVVDAQTANLLVQILDALNPQNKAKMLSLPIVKMVDVAWKLAKR